MRKLLLLFLPLLGLAQAPYSVEGSAVYRGTFLLGAWEGKNPTARGEVFWDGKEKAGGKVCLDQRAWDSGNEERDEKARKILKVEAYPEACLHLERAYRDGEVFWVEGRLEMVGQKRPVRIEGRLFEGFPLRFEGRFRTRFSDWGLERPSLLFLQVDDPVEVRLRATLHLK
ncbi:MAG: YceI family protein [Thermus sp.]|uniref:YceI family protein n=1 Tax=Thermus sp. TaxID=275 RepID=UPI00332DD378